MVVIEFLLEPTGRHSWYLKRTLKRSACPPIGTSVRAECTVGSLQVTRVGYWIDEDRFVVHCQGDLAKVLGFNHDKSWAIVETMPGSFELDQEVKSYFSL